MRELLDRRMTCEQQKLAEENVPLTLYMTGRFLKHYHLSASWLDDLISAAQMGLLYAAMLFDETKGYRFSTYAARSIWHWLHKSWRSDRVIKLPGRIPAELIQKLPRASSDASGKPSQSIRDKFFEPLAGMMDFKRRDVVEDLLRKIPSRLAAIIRLRFYEDKSLREIGKQFGVGHERIRQLQNQALRKLKVLLTQLGKAEGTI